METTELKTAVVYARYSSHRQGEQSIEGQLAAAYKYARDNNLRIIHEYIDRAMTGRNDNREQFQEMLKDTSKKQFSVIIVWKIDRFGRNREEIAFNKHKCKKNGVKVVYVAENVPDSPEGVILESVLEGMAEYYSLQLSQNIRRGNRASAEKCQSTGGNRPLGYKTDPVTKKFVIDPDTAPTVRKIYDMYAKGLTCAEIITELNAQGLRTLRGGKFTKNSLHTVLKNEKYIGVYTYKDEIRIEGGIPAIIDVETFARVQEMLKKNRRAPAHTWSRANYILTDKLFCGHCGSNMVGESGTSKTGAKHNYYICTKRKRERACHKKAVRQEWIEGIVKDAVLDLLFDEDTYNFIIDGVWECYQEEQKDTDYVIGLKKQLAEVEKAQGNLIKAIEAGIFNTATKNRMEELEAQKLELMDAIAGAELSKDFKLTRDYIEFYFDELRNRNTEAPEYVKTLIDTFVNAVFVYDDKVTITFNYSGDNRTITLAEIDAAENSDSVRMQCVKDHQQKRLARRAGLFTLCREVKLRNGAEFCSVAEKQSGGLFRHFLLKMWQFWGNYVIIITFFSLENDMNTEKWLNKNAESLVGKTVAVTGTTGGIGRELCFYLARLGASLILLDRNATRSENFKNELLTTFPNMHIECLNVDMERFETVQSVCETLKNRKVDIFVHNAGAYSIPRHTCETGFDNVFQINFASPYYMIRELEVEKTVVVGSIAHNYSKMDINDIDFSTRKASSKVYGNSKRFLMFSLYELFKGKNTLSITHPGITFTNITNHYPRLIFAVIKRPMKIIFMKPKKAALSVLKGVFDKCGYHEWIGPRLFDVWGLPNKKKLKTCSVSESEQIAKIAEEIYKKLRQ